MKTTHWAFLTLGLVLAAPALAENKDGETFVLYQVGKDGRYCVSYTTNEAGCISGTGANGDTTNIINMAQGRRIVFKNISDAPHDMKLSGANGANMPAQFPGGGEVGKTMDQIDPEKQKITCTYHGNQLAVGYTVPKGFENGGADGHKDPVDLSGARRPAGGGGGGGPVGDTTANKFTRTGLADVSGEVLTKGRQDQVEKLVSARPELMNKLQELRPLLAQELAQQGVGGGAGGAGGVATTSIKGLPIAGTKGDGAIFGKEGGAGGGLPALAGGASGAGGGGLVANTYGKGGAGSVFDRMVVKASSKIAGLIDKANLKMTDDELEFDDTGGEQGQARSGGQGRARLADGSNDASTGRAVASAPDEYLDRTRLKKAGLLGDGPAPWWRRWFLLAALVGMTLFVAYQVLSATRRRKAGAQDPGGAVVAMAAARERKERK